VYTQILCLLCGAFLLSSVLLLWWRELSTTVALLAVQGTLLGALACLLALHGHDDALLGAAVAMVLVKAVLLPALLRRALARATETRDAVPLLGAAPTMVLASLLTLLAYAVSAPLTRAAPSAATRAVPVGLAAVLFGLLALTTRRQALSQVAGLLLLDNGIAATALLTAGGVAPIVERGVCLDLVLMVLVLLVLTSRLRTTFGATTVDDLRELAE
jgi:hydrogenase-4 component E